MKYDFELVLEEESGLSKILRQVRKGSTVLEFGPATGRATAYLKEHLDCKVYIVEIDAQAAASAAKFAEDTIIGDIEDYEWLRKWENEKFDSILFADVLEHLRNPQKVLAKTKLLLKDDGKTLLSVPNVAHNSVLINLYHNVFHYTPVGLLDDTHIHLFSYHTLKFCCDQAGYVPVVEDAVYSAVGENEVSADYHQVNAVLRRELQKRIYRDVYQFVFVLQKKEEVNQQGNAIEKRIKPYAKDHKCQVFFDRGEGWLEEENVTIPISLCGGQKEIKVTLCEPEEIKNIRIDPVDCASGICVERLRLLDCNGAEIEKLPRESVSSNATYRIENNFLFLTDDPNVYLYGISWENIAAIDLAFTIVDKEEMAARLLEQCDVGKDYKSILAQLENKYSDEEHKRMELETKILACNEELDRRAKELE
ncbi:MAG: class I SAM-dependent methyltransferase, partial [Eubacterium sp.]|nr:class I SAM-dependent methyltransferase [Eubacterium sp.]